MSLTNGEKLAIVITAIIIGAANLIWTGIKIDVLALGLNDHVFNIGMTVLTTLNVTIGGVLVYLGIKAPTLEDRNKPPAP